MQVRLLHVRARALTTRSCAHEMDVCYAQALLGEYSVRVCVRQLKCVLNGMLLRARVWLGVAVSVRLSASYRMLVIDCIRLEYGWFVNMIAV